MFYACLENVCLENACLVVHCSSRQLIVGDDSRWLVDDLGKMFEKFSQWTGSCRFS